MAVPYRDAVAAGVSPVHRANVTAHNLSKVQLLTKIRYRKLRNACTELHASVKWPHRDSRCSKRPSVNTRPHDRALVVRSPARFNIVVRWNPSLLRLPEYASRFSVVRESLRKHHLRESPQNLGTATEEATRLNRHIFLNFEISQIQKYRLYECYFEFKISCTGVLINL